MKEEYKELKELQKRYLTRLSDLYPTIAAASTEIINLQAILNLPKGTEHFQTDVHGEYEAFFSSCFKKTGIRICPKKDRGCVRKYDECRR